MGGWESDLSDLSDLSDTYSLTCWLVGLLACCGGVFFVNNWWEIVFFCVVFSFLL